MTRACLYALSWWGALIVSAAQIAGPRHLLYEDLSHGHDLDGVQVVDPATCFRRHVS